MAGYSPTELMAIVIAREFRDGEVVVMGAVPALPMAACMLARAMHAPGLSYLVGGSGTVNPDPDALPDSSCDAVLGAATTTLPLHEVVMLEGRGNAFDVFCAGGLQIDAFGNCNLISIGDWERPSLRGPGTVGLPFLPATKRAVIYSAGHNPRTFVEHVDFVSGPGHPGAPGEDRAYRQEGPSLVVTPLARMDFDPESRRMRIASIHPGVTEDEVRTATGFELADSDGATETQPPSAEELEVLRRIDGNGVLAG
ncbi:MAG: CoA-transferase subunit beta [Acidimicrobiia bacterium]